MDIELEGPARQRRRDRLQRRIESCAIELFESRGYEAVTVAEIAVASDISTRTFFRYFATKDEVLFAGTDEGLERLAEMIVDRPSQEKPPQVVRSACIEYARELEDQIDLLVRREALAATNPSIRRRERAKTALWQGRLHDALGGRKPDAPDLSLRLLADCATMVLAAAIHEVWLRKGVLSLADATAASFDALASVVRP